MRLGAQLYTVRDYTKDLGSFSQTLAKIADIGYTTVQVSGTCAYEARWLRDELQKNGLECPVTHTSPARIAENPAQVADDHRLFGAIVAGIGCAPGAFDDPDIFSKFTQIYLPAAKAMKERGILLGYHNHQIEFAKTGGKTALEQLAEDFPRDLLTFILDTYWVQYGGGSAPEWLRKLKGRVHCVHFKDMQIVGREQRMASVGEGNLPWEQIISACEDAGTQFALVEQDNCYGEDPFDCLKRSYQYLRSLGLS